ncbi:MAG: NAD(P)H-hydrate dehydratase [Betaproteobacteria bacterium]|nr:NAD(P)H-hydrate dehydratase [Betaproteobacteria bacterium]
MTELLTLDEIRAAEHQASITLAPHALMERAGNAAAAWITAHYPPPRPVIVLTGPGNNGGDGWVVARQLLRSGFSTTVITTGHLDPLPEDAALARRHYLETGGPIATHWSPQQNPLLIVDALFGIGLNRAPEGRYAKWIALLDEVRCPIISLDIPSGLNGDTGLAPGLAIHASHTLTFIAAKAGLYTADGPDHCGIITVLDLHIPAHGSGMLLAGLELIRAWPQRRRNTHKGQFGSVGILGGARGMTGAALLAACAALKCGAGRVWLATLDETPAAQLATLRQPELMAATPQELLRNDLLTTLVVGPGMGHSEQATTLLAQALALPCKLILDADALNLISTHPDLVHQVNRRTAPTILTPHPAEALRLLDGLINSNRVQTAITLAQRYQSLVVLKGGGSVIANPQGNWWINVTGNAGLSAAGMGDVLAGAIGALAGQGLSPLQALQCAVYAHGAAADHCVARGMGPVGLTASEVTNALRQVLNAR